MTMPPAEPSVALSRFTMIELSHVRSGPTCVKQFADFGADVIKLESPAVAGEESGLGGTRDAYEMQNLHRNERSLTPDLKRPEAKEIFHRSCGAPTSSSTTIAPTSSSGWVAATKRRRL